MRNGSRVWRMLVMSFLGITLMGGSAWAGPTPAKQRLVPGVVAAGFSHSLSLGPDGTAWAWGSNESGELGIGTVGSEATPTPVKIPSLTDVVAVSAGHHFSLALRSDGTVWAWGKNHVGQLGIGTVSSEATPAPVKIPGLTNVVAIAAGHTFAMALRSDGTVWAWGHNGSGTLGVGSPNVLHVPTPTQVVGLKDVVSIVAAGGGYSLALRSDGTVWAWGDNSAYQLGEDSLGRARPEPVQVTGLKNVVSISTGWAHVLALSADGTVWAWGNNAHGQLGTKSKEINRAEIMAVPGLSDVVAIVAGPSSFRSLALRRDGTVWVWGMEAGQQPRQMLGIQNVLAASSGTEALLLDKDGSLWAWRPNTTGAPVPVVGLSCRLSASQAKASPRCLAKN